MKVIPWLLGGFLSTACHAPRAGIVPAETAACALDARPEVIPVENPKPGELNEFFELPDSPAWWASAPMDPEREQYRAALVIRLGGEQGLRQRALLERQNAGPSARAVKSGKREADNSDRVLER